MPVTVLVRCSPFFNISRLRLYYAKTPQQKPKRIRKEITLCTHTNTPPPATARCGQRAAGSARGTRYPRCRGPYDDQRNRNPSSLIILIIFRKWVACERKYALVPNASVPPVHWGGSGTAATLPQGVRKRCLSCSGPAPKQPKTPWIARDGAASSKTSP